MKLTAVITPDALADGSPMYMAHCPELDITTPGETPDIAKANLKEAVEGVLEVASAVEVEQRFGTNSGMVSELDVAA